MLSQFNDRMDIPIATSFLSLYTIIYFLVWNDYFSLLEWDYVALALCLLYASWA